MSSSANSSPDPRLERILAELIQAAESGAVPDPDVWATRHPAFASEIREFLAGQRQLNQAVQRAAKELSPLESEPTVLTDSAGPEPNTSAFRLISRGATAPGPVSGQVVSERPRVRYFGDYELLEEIARGGMGVVYKARQVNLKRIVALKMILVGQLANDDDVRRFYAEAEAAAKLEHPNIVPIFEIGQHEGQHYFSMQFIDGESLAHRVSRGVLDLHEAAEIMLKVARAIAYAHVEGVIHRDLKPANILLEGVGVRGQGLGKRTDAAASPPTPNPQPLTPTPRITDFGLAMRVKDGDAEQTEAARLTATGQILGTPSYMPPEQAAGRTNDVGRLADVYSLGAVLYCLLTGRPPFQAASPLDTLMQVIHAEPVALRLLNPTVPRDLETICLKCLEKEPSRRYAGAAELADDLERFLNDEPIVARPIGHVERLVRMARKHRQTLARTAATVALSLLAVLGGWSSWQSYQESMRGTVELRTSGSQMVADVLDDQDRSVVPSFPVPTPEPIALPEGSYRVRLSASGLLSDTWPLDVERGQSKTLDVQFRSRLLWPPRELPTDEYLETEMVDVGWTPSSDRSGQSPNLRKRSDEGVQPTSILQIRHQVAGQYGGRFVHTLRLIDGATGKPAWPADVTLDEASLPKGRNIQEWTSLFGATGLLEQDHRLVRPLVDLDGDGVRDLMFVARTTPALVAFSGRDGKLLWWHRSRPVLPALPENIDAASLTPTSALVRTGGVVGQAAVADVNSDGTSDAIACFMTTGESFQAPSGVQIRADAQGWMEAISGKDGSTLWKQKLETPFDQFLNSGSEAQKLNATARPFVVRSSAANAASSRRTSSSRTRESSDRSLTTSATTVGDAVVLIVDRWLFGFELETGKPTLSRTDLPAVPQVTPVVADLNLDGEDELVLLSLGERAPNANSPPLVLTAISQLGKVLWSKPFESRKQEHDLRRSAHPVFRVDDIDGDSRPEVLLPIGQLDYSHNDRWSGLAVFNGGTGETRWQKRIASARYSDPPTIERFTSGPDLDGDGAREVFVTWRDYDQESNKPVAIVAAMSGRDGSRLWNWKHEAGSSYSSPDPSGSLQWWQPGPDGFPLLVVPMLSGPGGQAMTFILSASTGRLEHTLSEVFDPHVADFNDDAIPDLYYTVSPQGSPRMLVAAGTQAEPWKRLGQWHPIQDVDGDRIGDFISAGYDHVRSGRDQRTLFRIPEPPSEANRYPVISPPLPFGDLNADGTLDLIGMQVAHRRTEYGSSSYHTLAAFSGKDGRRLWLADKFELSYGQGSSSTGDSWSEEIPAFDWCELDNDDRAELAVVLFAPTGQSVLLSMISGRDGQLLWQLPIRRGSFGSQPNPYGREFADFNGDGVRDLALWTPQPNTADSYDPPSDLQLISGRDGKPLWPKSNVSIPQGGRPLWPRPAVGDLDGDGQPEVVVAWHKGYDNPPEPFQLTAVDGRTGDVKWNHEWSGTNADILPPMLVDFEGDGQREVCFGTFGTDGLQLTVLGDDGQSRPGSPFKLSSSWRPGGSRLWNKVDLASDGKEALLLAIDDKLCLSRGTNDLVWQWPLDTSPQREYSTNSAMLLDWQVGRARRGSPDPAAGPTVGLPNSGRPTVNGVARSETGHSANDDPTLAIWSGQGVYGLNAATGAMRWRCRVPWSPGTGFSHAPTVQLMSSDDSSGAPRVLCHWRMYFADNWHTLTRQAQPTTPDGRVVSHNPPPRRYAPIADEAVPRIKLPWVTSRREPLHRFVETIAVPSGLVTLFVLVVPIWLVRATLRGCRMGTLARPNSVQREDGQECSSYGRALTLGLLLAGYAAMCLSPALFGYRQGVTSVIAFGVVMGLTRRAIREREWQPALLALGYSALLIAPLAVLHFWAFRHPLQRAHSWQNWWWLDELTAEPLMVAIGGLPGVAFWWSLVKALRRRDRTAVQRLLIAATLAAAVCGAIMLTVDSRSLTAEQHYSLAGWYAIWFWGVPVVGAWLLLRQGLKSLIALRKSRHARRQPQHA